MNDSIVGVLSIAVLVLVIASFWKLFVKAGEPGWKSIIPLYNIYVFLKISGKPGWWIVLFFIPLVSIIMWVVTYVGLAKRFGKGVLFGIGATFLPFIFLPILAFGDAQYRKSEDMSSVTPVASTTTPTM